MTDSLYIPPSCTTVATPSHRWNRVIELVDSGNEPYSRQDDRYVREAYAFWRQMSRTSTSSEQKMISFRWPSLYQAYLTYKMDGPSRWILEALIVGQAKTSDVMAATGLSPDVLTWYEKIFFDEREKCRNKAYVLFSLVPEACDLMTARLCSEAVWKLVAAFAGLTALAQLVKRGSMSEEGSKLLNEWIDGEVRRNLFYGIGGLIGKSPESISAMLDRIGSENIATQQKLDAAESRVKALPSGSANPMDAVLAVITYMTQDSER